MLKKFFFFLAFLCLASLSCLALDLSYWGVEQVREYVHNAELQRRWSISFLAPHLKQLRGDERVLDIGCGDGKITADISRFIPQGTIQGIDPSKAMLDWAQKQYSSLDYPNLYFQEGGFLEPKVEGYFDIIFSNCALQHCENQKLAFETLAQILNPNGKILLLVPAINNPAWKQAFKNVDNLKKWSPYLKDFPPRKFLTVEKYKELLSTVNLHSIRVESIETKDPFIDKNDFLRFLVGTFTPKVPLEMQEEYFSEIIDEYIRLLPDALLPNGVIEARFGRIEIEAKKLISDCNFIPIPTRS